MKHHHILGLLLVSSTLNAAENRAVSEINYELSARYANVDFGDLYSGGGRLSIPVQRFGGISLVAGANSLDGNNNVIDSDSYSVGATAFIRDYDLGKISTGYLYRETRLNFPNTTSPVNADDKVTSKRYTLAGDYYYRNITAGISGTFRNTDDLNSHDAWSFAVLSYWKMNTRFGASGRRVDGQHQYALNLSYQPEAFRNSTELSLGYSDIRNDDPVYSVSIRYHFAARPSLIERDRKYR